MEGIEEFKTKCDSIKKMSYDEKYELLKKVSDACDKSSYDGDCDGAYLSFKVGTSDITFSSKYEYSLSREEFINNSEKVEDWVCLINSCWIEDDYYEDIDTKSIILTDVFKIPVKGHYNFKEISEEKVIEEFENSDEVIECFYNNTKNKFLKDNEVTKIEDYTVSANNRLILFVKDGKKTKYILAD